MAGELNAGKNRLLGIHIRTATGLVTGARHALKIGCTTFQIMSGNPSAWNPGKLDPARALEFRRFLDEHCLRPVFLHAGYLINLSCRRGGNAPLYAKSLKLLKSNLERAVALSCEYVVVHLGSRRGYDKEESLQALIEGFCKLDKRKTQKAQMTGAAGPGDPSTSGWPMLLLENGAGSGDSVGSRLQELAIVMDAAKARGVRQTLGACLDTAHLWGAGYDLTSAAAARRLVDKVDEILGIDRLHLIHLNDSPVERGSLKDRHEHLGNGVISLSALKAIARHPKLRQVAMILETPGKSRPSDEERMADLRALAGM